MFPAMLTMDQTFEIVSLTQLKLSLVRVAVVLVSLHSHRTLANKTLLHRTKNPFQEHRYNCLQLQVQGPDRTSNSKRHLDPDPNLGSGELLVTVLCLRSSFSNSWTGAGNAIVENPNDTAEMMLPWKPRVEQFLYATSKLAKCLSLLFCFLPCQTKIMSRPHWGLLCLNVQCLTCGPQLVVLVCGYETFGVGDMACGGTWKIMA